MSEISSAKGGAIPPSDVADAIISIVSLPAGE